MTKCSRALLLCLPVWAALLCATPAHAGMLGWMDDTFTFREEQKPLVQPRRTAVPPKVVVQPYYPNDEHVSWSNFYTRTDLEPQDYLSSSASKIMRPRAQDTAASSPAQAAGGWPAIAERAAANAQAESEAQDNGGNVVIGEPGQSPLMQSGESTVGRATRIGPAVEDWRNEGKARIASRPGDYDYRAPVGANAYVQAETPGIAISDANPTARTDGGTVTTFSSTSDDPRYLQHNAKGQVTKYKVQSGDTLGSISDQPAIYGTWKLWPLIYSANRKAIGGSPSNLKVQQRLDIPRDYSEKQARDAELKAGR